MINVLADTGLPVTLMTGFPRTGGRKLTSAVDCWYCWRADGQTNKEPLEAEAETEHKAALRCNKESAPLIRREEERLIDMIELVEEISAE